MTPSEYTVRLENLIVEMSVGLLDWEKEKKQRVCITIEMTGKPDAKRENIVDCIDYSRVHAYITQNWPDKPHTELLETLAQELLDFCLQDGNVAACRVTLQKPDVFTDGSIPSVCLSGERS